MISTLKALFVAFIVATIYLHIFSYIFCRTEETQFARLAALSSPAPERGLTAEDGQTSRGDGMCPLLGPGTGPRPVPADTRRVRLADVEDKYPAVSVGGTYKPPCNVTEKVAIIVPYRDREDDLAIFLNHIHPFLMKQQIEYGIFVIEQAGGGSFNRGKLLNVGFLEAGGSGGGRWTCFVFHDVDLLPRDARNRYGCGARPRHLSVAVDTLHYMLPYRRIFGGVTALTHEQFTRLNGYSNEYWGWGGEDDDMYHRLVKRGYDIARDEPWIGKYTMLRHEASPRNPKRHALVRRGAARAARDGLSSLRYRRLRVTRARLFTAISVDIDT